VQGVKGSGVAGRLRLGSRGQRQLEVWGLATGRRQLAWAGVVRERQFRGRGAGVFSGEIARGRVISETKTITCGSF
jgi:hypothetical protein